MSVFPLRIVCLCVLFVFETCTAVSPHIGRISPGFQGSPMNWIDNHGQFLVSNNSIFTFRFYGTLNSSYVLIVTHINSSTDVWTANRGLLVKSSDRFVFEKNGNAYLEGGSGKVWSSNTGGKGVAAMELWDNGNLVLLDNKGNIVWESFRNPTDTLLSGQAFLEGMKLKSFPHQDNLFHYMEMKSGDLIMYAGYQTPQLYWSMSSDIRKVDITPNRKVHSASLISNSWNFYNESNSLVWQFNFSDNTDPNAMWAAVLDSDGSVSFKNLQKGKSVLAEPIRIPQKSCSVPEPCDPYKVCSFDGRCQCPDSLTSLNDCKPDTISFCNRSMNSVELLYIGEKLDYFAIGFVEPVMITNLNACREACLRNCSCSVLFFSSGSGGCYLFDQIGSLQRTDQDSTGFTSYMKISNSEDVDANQSREDSKEQRKHILLIMIIVVTTVVLITALLYLGYWYHRKKNALPESVEEYLEEDSFIDSFSGMPVRYSYNELSKATKNFSLIVGRGGFGSVYKGMLPDGTELAVKKLESIGQGKKEFRSEVSIIGSVHHVHLVKLKGFCSEGSHRLLVYEYMGKGSLDKWIFKNNKTGASLDWNTRFNIALGTAKGLAYLHEECEVKIVHCDIKPENVLLDDNYNAKVSDFGLAKLMQREESLVYTTLRGTRGYLAPEWITNYSISEKSDVYSYGLVLFEIIGGRKNYDPEESMEKLYFPSYVLKMLEEGKLKEVVDLEMKIDEKDGRLITAVKVAFWCIQDEMHLRPAMTKVVQMLEGLCEVPNPPNSLQKGFRAYSSLFKWSSEEGTSSGFNGYNSDAFQSDVRLSGPR